MIKNRIVVIEKSTNKNRTFVLFSCVNLYTFKNLFDIIGTVTRTNSKNMTGPEVMVSSGISECCFIRKNQFCDFYS